MVNGQNIVRSPSQIQQIPKQLVAKLYDHQTANAGSFSNANQFKFHAFNSRKVSKISTHCRARGIQEEIGCQFVGVIGIQKDTGRQFILTVNVWRNDSVLFYVAIRKYWQLLDDLQRLKKQLNFFFMKQPIFLEALRQIFCSNYPKVHQTFCLFNYQVD